MPKKALYIYFGLALVGAALFTWLSFPVHPDKYSTSKNQPVPVHTRDGTTAPDSSAAPAKPVFVTIPDTPAASMTGKVLHVFAFGAGNTAERLRQELDLYSHQTGNSVTEVIANPTVPYQQALGDALRSPAPPDIVLLDAADLSGVTPERDLLPAAVPAQNIYIPQVQGTFVRSSQLWAIPDEYSEDVLFFNKACFDRAVLGYPGQHWTLDILESISRGLTDFKLVDPQGRRIFALELPADFQLWNLLSAEAGRPVCDAAGWHLGDPKATLQHVRGLDFFQTYFRDLDVIVPLTNDEQAPGDLFVQGRACLLVAPIEARDRFSQNPDWNWGVTRFPQDIRPSTNLRVRGWAVAKTTHWPKEAAGLVEMLTNLPVNDGWVSAFDPTNQSIAKRVPNDALGEFAYSMIPTAIFYPMDANTRGLEHSLTQKLQHFAETNSDGVTTDSLYKTLVTQALPESQPIQVQTGLPQKKKTK